MKHEYIAFTGNDERPLGRFTAEDLIHDLDGILDGPGGQKWRIVASERIHGFESEGGDVATYYVIPASVPPHHEALYLSQCLAKAATK